mmetsp:Transcript_5333/g.10558  ORF Transcript_5333/g.10558 Transcript_5333/m.10558 type:complete len:354 (+) Transcript_5333:205-1266(+)|eukprot:scaffold244_cov172-Amphora_coffeaeformis.AAC.6
MAQFLNNTNGTVHSTRRVDHCDTSLRPLQKLMLRDDGTYLLLNDSEDDPEDLFEGNTPGSSHGRSLSDIFGSETVFDAIYPVSSTDKRELMQVVNNSKRIVYGRQCTCALTQDPVFCPIEAKYCRVWERGAFLFSRGSPTMKCETPNSMKEDFAMRFTLPIIMCLYLFLTCFIVGTKKGKNAATYTTRLLCCWEEDQYQQVLIREVEEQARQRARETQRRARAAWQLESLQPRPTTKVPACIKTKLYDKTSLHQECMICLANFLDGDRVGNLKCGHTFHIDPCLKEWVERKNHCPLCHSEDLAVPTDKAPKPKPVDEISQDGDTGISPQYVIEASSDSTGSEHLHAIYHDPQV